jgi:hypothetical protein
LWWPNGQNDKTGHWRAAPAAAWEQDPRRRKFPRGSASARGLQPGRILETARPETAGRTPRGLTLVIGATKPDQNPGTSTRASKTSARRGTRRNPMSAHETSPVSGASVVGMTYGAHHRPGSMPAGVPGVPAASAREDRLRPKGRLRRQPAGDSIQESWSRAMRTRLLNGCLAKSRTVPTRAAEAQDRSDERHDRVQPMRGRRPFPTTGSKAKEKGYALQMPAQGKGTL